MLSKDKRLSALAWAAAQADLSYGRFTMNLSQKDKLKIYKQFQNHLDQKAVEEAAKSMETDQKKASSRKRAPKKVASVRI